jgi:hypothetical protein
MLAIATLIFSCRKNKEQSYNYTFFGLENGADWKAQSLSVMAKPDTLYISVSTFDKNDDVKKHLTFTNISLSKGRQLLFNKNNPNRAWAVFYTLLGGGDVIDGNYIPCEGQDNFIEIQEIDLYRKYIKGIFQVTFIQDKPYRPYLPDTIRFTNGTFSSYYK